ncbi:FAD-dependent oxidoreductase [Mesorhizobium sp. DCY119]|uniref:FAD-dependent oxidoreductase n=1 Tax=Mesorhizobium sp. DCY119 TaxID=2108445 RepID=UPI0014025C62|nr:FAD-dependent oxidoreductase [Mesorhizobium sp. DCY119]
MNVVDEHSMNAMTFEVAETISLLVIGAGRSGIAVALEGARAGLQVVLVDENPVEPSLMGTDVPLAFGQRMTAAVQNRGKMVEQVFLNSPGLSEAFEAGVDVRLAMSAWGLFSYSEESRGLPGLVIGLEDGEKSWLARCDHVVVASGRRDVMLGFDGWDQPGVMGAHALHCLLRKYQASSSRRIVILGSGDLALSTAIEALDHGLQVMAVVEPGPEVEGSEALCAELAARGVEVTTQRVIKSADGGADGVTAITLVSLDTKGRTVLGTETKIECDTVCLAVATTPNIELLAAAGCDVRFDGRLGVWAPVLVDGVTSIERVQAVGSCCGPNCAQGAEERARSVVARIVAGEDVSLHVDRVHSSPVEYEPTYLDRWTDALVEAGGLDVLACRCETVTRRELLDVSPPAYLNARTGSSCQRNLQTLLLDGTPHPDQIKRLTRSGMGECQGRRCREQTAMLLARAAGLPLGKLPLASYRAPVRPLPLAVLGNVAETPEMTRGWDSWFGIPMQFAPFWEADSEKSERSGKGWHL